MPLLLGLACMLICLVMLGGIVGGDTLLSWGPLGMGLSIHARVFVRFPDLSRLFRGLSFGRPSLHSQSLDTIHLRVNNPDVVRDVGRLLDGVEHSRPVGLENDWDLIALVREMIDRWSEGTACISKVKGCAGEDMVRQEQVRGLDREGNHRADEGADFGRRRVDPEVIDARRNPLWCL